MTTEALAAPSADTGAAVVRELRTTRMRRRLGDTEWFDVAYRAYLFALVGLIATVFVSDAIRGQLADELAPDVLVDRGPAILGVITAVAVAAGVRSGADGGPVAIEAADVRHLLLAPVARSSVLRAPTLQRVRAAAFAGALIGGAVGQFVAIEQPGSRAAWAGAAALAGAATGAAFIAVAVLVHGWSLSRPAATAMAGALLVWQIGAAYLSWVGADQRVAGPFDSIGAIALWGVDADAVDALGLMVIGAFVVAAIARCGALSIEALVRRADLVSQLRFAATTQDLRTVVLLRRQLRAETMRQRPWGGVGRRPRATSPAVAVWQRGARSIRRFPLARLARIAGLAAAGGIAAAIAYESAPIAVLITVAATFVIGMEGLEPLAQEIDHPDLTDRLGVEPSWLYGHHLVAPAGMLAVASIVGAIAVTIAAPGLAFGAFSLAVPTAVAGAVGPLVATVTDAARPAAIRSTTLTAAPRGDSELLMPPEFAGFSTAMRTLLPVALSAAAAVPVLVMRADPGSATAGRVAVGCALYAAGAVVWVRRRDAWGLAVRRFFAGGRAAT
ncbi:MAG: hypothetical protein AAGA42_08955 [Actinomycetota bacterium]